MAQCIYQYQFTNHLTGQTKQYRCTNGEQDASPPPYRRGTGVCGSHQRGVFGPQPRRDGWVSDKAARAAGWEAAP